MLASRLGASEILGIPDPFSNWLSGEVQSAFQRARLQLMKQDWLRENHRVQVSQPLGLLGQCIVGPKHFLRLCLSGPQQALEQLYFLGPTYCARLESIETSYEATLWDSRSELAHELLAACQVKDLPTGPGPFRLTEAAVQKARQTILRGQPFPQEIASACGPVAALAVQKNLQFTSQNGCLLWLNFEARLSTTTSVAFLSGPEGLWRLKPCDQDSEPAIDFLPGTAREIQSEIGDLLHQLAG